MPSGQRFLFLLGADPNKLSEISALAKRTGVSVERLRYYHKANVLPTGADLQAITNTSHVTPDALRLGMGLLDHRLLEAIQSNVEAVLAAIQPATPSQKSNRQRVSLELETDFGSLYRGRCEDLLAEMQSESVDLVFADPPFNLSKLYKSQIDDNLREDLYLQWCERWIDECCRVLKHGGSFFVWNLPKWNARLSAILGQHLTFRHWIAVDIKYSLPLPGKLYPSHYSLLYFVKGARPAAFAPDRLPMEICPHCYGDLRDYGGYKDKMNPSGVNLTDVWFDIAPVRHAKYKKRKDANELSLKLMDRVIEMGSNPGDLVFDPFGGAGTTYVAAELKRRKWIGVELGPVSDIIDRFKTIQTEAVYLDDLRQDLNALFPTDVKCERLKRRLWTTETEIARKSGVRDRHPVPGELDLS